MPIAKVRENVVARIGTTRIMVELDHFSVAVKQLVQSHLFPVVNPEIISLFGVLAAKCEIGIASRAKQYTGNRFAV